MKGEIWKPVKNYEGLYEVSNLGRVKSLGNGKSRNSNYSKERILKAKNSGNGYLQVVLSKDGKSKNYLVHRLVAQAFVENPKGYNEVNHKNEVKSDNRADNLEFCNRAYNNNYGTRNKKVAEKVSEKLKGRKQTEEHIKKRAEKMTNNPKLSKPVICINKVSGLIVEFPSISEASRQTGINLSNICECCNGKKKSAGGFQWLYIDDNE